MKLLASEAVMKLQINQEHDYSVCFVCNYKYKYIKKYNKLKRSLLSVFTALVLMGSTWRWCSHALHGASVSIYFYSFCTETGDHATFNNKTRH